MSALMMLDTNMVSYFMREKDAKIKRRLVKHGMANVCISVLTEAELLYGVELCPATTNLNAVVEEFLARVSRYDWDSEAANCYARLRHDCKQNGVALSNIDMLIAAHAIALDATLVTSDRVFTHISKRLLKTVDWA